MERSSLENFSMYVHCKMYTVHTDPLLLKFEILKDMKRFNSAKFNLKILKNELKTYIFQKYNDFSISRTKKDNI